jgi:hypothetical protein
MKGSSTLKANPEPSASSVAVSNASDLGSLFVILKSTCALRDVASQMPEAARFRYRLERAEHDLNQMNDVSEFRGPNWAEGLDPDEIAEVIVEEDGIRRRNLEAEIAYIDAVNARDLYARVKAICRKTPPRAELASALKDGALSQRHAPRSYPIWPVPVARRERPFEATSFFLVSARVRRSCWPGRGSGFPA